MEVEDMRRQSEADDEIDFGLVFGRKKVPATASTAAPLNLTGLGTVGGVLLPCVQNILGVLVFLRLPWICGQSGIVIAVVQVCICVGVTSLTSLSMAAIATNGKIRAGGSYAMISSCLGPSFGISIGILFYLGTAVGSGLYVLGAAEAFLNTVKPEENPTVALADSYVNNLRLWGLMVGLLLFLCVSTGIKRVSAIGMLFLIPVFIGIIAAWVGVFVAGEPEGVSETYPTDLFPDVTGSIGLSLSNLKDNLWPDYQSGISFGSTLAVLFPGLTGFEAGSNRSGRLKDPSRAIPAGTAGAIISTFCVYLSFIFLFGACVPRQVLQDLEKEGFIVAKVAWPYPLVVQIAVILSSAGAGLQTLAGAPEILAAISTDFKSEIPCLRHFSVDSADAEPRKALLFSTLLVLLVVCLGDINVVAPIITQFLVLAYIFINVACVLMVVLKSPSWRPTFKHFSKYSGSVAVLLGVFIMFVDSWYMAVISVGIFLGLYYYIQSLSIERDWGDGIKGMKYTQAIENLLDLNYYSQHVRNYRPSFLLIQEMSIVIDQYSNQPTFDKNPIDQPLLELSNTLTLGKGGTQMIAVIEADSDDRKNPWETNTDANKLAEDGTRLMRRAIRISNVRALGRAICWHNANDAAVLAIQSTGLGVLTPNTLVLRYPHRWKVESHDKSFFLSCLSAAFAFKKAAVVGVGMDVFPKPHERFAGTIDVWWQHDQQTGQLMLLFASILKKTRIWKKCRIRLFAFAYRTENSKEIERKLARFLDEIRIKAEIIVVEVEEAIKGQNDITYAEAAQRTMQLDDAQKLLKLLQEAKEAEEDAKQSSEQPLRLRSHSVAQMEAGGLLVDHNESVAEVAALISTKPSSSSSSSSAAAPPLPAPASVFVLAQIR